MTNQQLNIAIVKAMGINYSIPTDLDSDEIYIYKDVHSTKFSFKSWNNLMPLCTEHDISYRKTTDLTMYIARHMKKNDKLEWHIIERDCLQRALAECLLIVLQEKNQ